MSDLSFSKQKGCNFRLDPLQLYQQVGILCRRQSPATPHLWCHSIVFDLFIINKSVSTSCVSRSLAERDALHLPHVTLNPAVEDKEAGAADVIHPLMMTSKSEPTQSQYLASWWVATVLRPGPWTSRSGCGPAGPSGSRSVRSPRRAQCDFHRPGCAPAAPCTAAPARRRRTSADAPHTRPTGTHENFITNHFLNLLELVVQVNIGTFLKSNTSSTYAIFISRPIIKIFMTVNQTPKNDSIATHVTQNTFAKKVITFSEVKHDFK